MNVLKKKYFSNNEQLQKNDNLKFDELQRIFYLKNWIIILLMSNYQSRYIYYSKAIKSVKDKSDRNMKTNEFLKLFENN